jgi:uncharacterized protein
MRTRRTARASEAGGRFRRKGRTSRPGWKRLYFATDIHGSEACFRKFVNAARFYDVQYLILGGDILGKLLVPIVRHADGTYSGAYGEHEVECISAARLSEFTEAIRRYGHYPVIGSADELAALADPGERDRVFRKVAFKSVVEWVSLAETRLRGTGVRLFMAPGNDDFLEIDDALSGSDVVEFAEGRRIKLDDVHEMITTGYSNPTPWKTERELPEPALRAKLDTMGAKVEDPTNLVAVIHAPPYGTVIDQAPKLDAEFNMSLQHGGVEMGPVGSEAVRGFIEETQPLIALCGHVHEAGGVARLGRTMCLNPGSEYTQAVLAGALVEISDGQVLSHQFVSG